jgi:pyruvate formate lyase activating enzyme
MKVRVTDIQHFSLHDGSGIRTTVFLKGCSIKCPWCANPECISPKIEGEFGYDISLEKLESEILKDEPFYKTGGGVTFSGGEPLLQIKALEPLLESLKNKNINICFETSLFVPQDYLEISKMFADEFIVDIKMLNPDNSKNILKGSIDQYLSNLKLLDLEKTIFRIPITEYSLNDQDLILELLNNFKPKKLEIFKLHNFSKRKYDILNRNFYYNEVEDSQIIDFYIKLKEIIPSTEIIEI